MITTTDVQNTENPFTRPAKRNVAPSAANVLEDMFDFMLDVSPDALPSKEIDNLYQLLGDLEYLDKRQINESLHFAKKSSTGARSIARKWYSANRGRVAKLQMNLKKSKGLQKKKEIRAKSGVTLTKKKNRKYNTKNHVNEYGFAEYIKENKIGENLDMSDFKFKQAIRKRVDEMFESKRYRVVQEFTIGEAEALLNESFEYFAGTWRLKKHNGEVWKFKGLEKEEIEKFIEEDK